MQGCKGIENKNTNNKALVHKGSTPLVHILFSDVSKITVSKAGTLPPKRAMMNVKIAEKNSSSRNNTNTK